MKTWLLDLWLDEAKFRAAVRACVYTLGLAFQSGYIPTGVSHGGVVLGTTLSILAFAIHAGQQNSQPVTPTEQAAAEKKVNDAVP